MTKKRTEFVFEFENSLFEPLLCFSVQVFESVRLLGVLLTSDVFQLHMKT